MGDVERMIDGFLADTHPHLSLTSDGNQKVPEEGVELHLKPKKEFEVARAKETEEFEKSHPAVGSNRKNKSNAEGE
ncbi:hypothetical protein WN944_000419 [Citrus x changshan-huyou]|uniref:Uncharacterized protein n=1 Tax=Citrus x changshan-huyou TaxID=2935761 RepID=A0AAP0MCU6_9ROSI